MNNAIKKNKRNSYQKTFILNYFFLTKHIKKMKIQQQLFQKKL